MKPRYLGIGYLQRVANDGRKFGAAAEYQHVRVIEERHGSKQTTDLLLTETELSDAVWRAAKNTEDIPQPTTSDRLMESIEFKILLLIIVVVLLAFASVGCARFTTTQSDTSYEKGLPVRTISTRATATTWFESKSALANFKASQTDKTQGASVGSLSQETNGTNAASTLREFRLLLETLR